MYHAADTRYDEITWDDICLTTDADEAAPYVEWCGGWLHEIDISPDARIADESDIVDAAEDLDIITDDCRLAFELVDRRELRVELARRGFTGCRYDDMGPDNAYTHETIRVWEPGTLSIVGVSEIEAE